MTDVLCLGEILVDWISTNPGIELHEAEVFTKAAGGAPANTAVSLARQGINTAFLGRVATDSFGLWLQQLLHQEQIDTSGLVLDPEAQTRMAYIVTSENGERKVCGFSTVACADARFSASDLLEHMFEQASLMHFGSISLIASPTSEATKQAIQWAHKHQVLLSFDPNVRLDLWPTAEHCRQTVIDTLPLVDVVKISENELEFLTGSQSPDAAQALRKQFDIPLLIITLGSGGAHAFHASGHQKVNSFQVQLVEDTGAGDGFNSGTIAALLPFIRKQNRADALPRAILQSLNLEDIVKIITRANAVGALTCTQKGAIPALPYAEQVDTFLRGLVSASPGSS